MAGIASRTVKATICCRRVAKNGSLPTKSALARRCRMAANAASISLGVLALRTNNCRPRLRPASCASFSMRALSGSFGFASTAISAALGTSCKPFAGDQHVEPTHSRDIAARPVEATHEALVNRIAASREHDRNVLGRRHGGQYRSATSRRDDHVDLAADQIGRQDRQAIEPILRKTVLDRHVAAIDIAGFTQTTAERCQEVGPVILAKHVQEPDHWRRWLLRARRERPRGDSAAEHCDELASLHHSITSSASSTNESGIVSPIALAALRFTINS